MIQRALLRAIQGLLAIILHQLPSVRCGAEGEAHDAEHCNQLPYVLSFASPNSLVFSAASHPVSAPTHKVNPLPSLAWANSKSSLFVARAALPKRAPEIHRKPACM